MVGRLLCFWDGLFSGAMLNFQGVLKVDSASNLWISEPTKIRSTTDFKLPERTRPCLRPRPNAHGYSNMGSQPEMESPWGSFRDRNQGGKFFGDYFSKKFQFHLSKFKSKHLYPISILHHLSHIIKLQLKDVWMFQ